MNVRQLREPKPYTPEQLEVADSRIRATCHTKQRAFVFDPGNRLSLLTGRGGGKTAAMLMRLIRAMMRRPGANCLYIAATRESAERLAWAELKRIISFSLRLSGAEYNESKLTLTLPNGAKLFLYGCDDKGDIQKLRGITYHEVGIDETASIKTSLLEELLLEVLGPRMVGTLCLIGTPGKQLDGLFFLATSPSSKEHRPWSAREQPEYAGWTKWSSHSWNITDGVEAGIVAMIEIHTAQLGEKLRNGWSDSNPYWLREYMGIWVADETAAVYQYRPYTDDGAEWNQWTPKLDQWGFAIVPSSFKDWEYGLGVDIGWKDAFALEVFAYSPSDESRTLYHVYEVYTPRIYARKLAEILIGEGLNHDKYGGIFARIGWPSVMVGDFARGGGSLLKELAEVYGITIVAADKPYQQKESSIELGNSSLYEGRVKIMKGSHLAEEMIALQWVTDPYGKRTENKAQNNHACDAWIYLRDALAPMLPAATAKAAEPPKMRQRNDDYVPPAPEPEFRNADGMYSNENLFGEY